MQKLYLVRFRYRHFCVGPR